MELAGVDDTRRRVLADDVRRRPTRVTAFVPVVHGCDKFCTYCIVPYRRGREKSRTIDDIRNEVEHYCARGVREVTLLGQTVEAYGHDLRRTTPDLGDLMRAHPRHRRPRAHPLPHVVPEGHDGAHHRRRRRAAEGVRELQHPGAVRRRRRARPHAPRLHARRVPREVRAGPRDASRTPRWSPTSSSASAARPTPSSSTRTTCSSACASTRCTSPRTRRAPARSPTARWPTTCPPRSKQERLHAIEQLEARVSFEINRAVS